MLLFCSINFQFVPPERCVYQKISSHRTGCRQNCVSPKLPKYFLKLHKVCGTKEQHASILKGKG